MINIIFVLHYIGSENTSWHYPSNMICKRTFTRQPSVPYTNFDGDELIMSDQSQSSKSNVTKLQLPLSSPIKQPVDVDHAHKEPQSYDKCYPGSVAIAVDDAEHDNTTKSQCLHLLCTEEMKQISTKAAAARVNTKHLFCDSCNAALAISHIDKVWHCMGDYNESHPNGYDLCVECHEEMVPAANQGKSYYYYYCYS